MRGTLRGDFSRGPAAGDTADRGVYLQQGRLLLDADWNAQLGLVGRRAEAGMADLIGANGGPEGRAGFGIEVETLMSFTGRAFAIIGGGGDLMLPVDDDDNARGVTVEARLAAFGDGTIAQFLTSDGDPVWTLSLVEGTIRFHRPGPKGGSLEGPAVTLDDRLHQLTVAASDTRTDLYLDGQQLATASFGLVPAAAAHWLLIGAANDAGQPRDPLRASLAGVRIWHTCLDAERVVQLGAERRIDERDLHLVGDWRFDDGHGHTVADHTNHRNHAEIRGHGFAWVPHAPRITAGRYYVDGMLCEQPHSLPFANQPDLPGTVFPRSSNTPANHLIYLDLWERSVSTIEDPSLEEVALGGVDTTVRSRQVTQVRSLEIPSADLPDGDPSPAWEALLESSRRRGCLRVRRLDAGIRELDNCLYRIEIHDSGFVYTWPRPEKAVAEAIRIEIESSTESGGGVIARLPSGARELRVGQPVEAFDESTDASQQPGPILIVEAIDRDAGMIMLSGDFGPLTSARTVSLRPVATFKWSRSNASTAFGIGRVDPSGTLVTLALSAGRVLELPTGAWLEAIDRDAELTGDRAPLTPVDNVDASAGIITLARPLPERMTRSLPKGAVLRLWDQAQQDPHILPTGVVWVDSTGDWQELELGIEVRFEGADRLRSGDYWWAVARADATEAIWPLDAENAPIPRGPDGVEHRYAPLALLSYEAEGFQLRDLRTCFKPLTDDGTGGADDLEVDGSLTVGRHAAIRGRLQADELLGRICGVDVVGQRALAPNAITRRALAPEVGIVPDGYALLGPAHSPAGYHPTDAALTLPIEPFTWQDIREVGDGPPGAAMSVAMNGTIYSFLASGEVWTIDASRMDWQQRRPQPIVRHAFAVALEGERIYLVGGTDAAGRPIPDVQAYEPETDQWHDCRPLPHGCARATATATTGWIYVMGGVRPTLFGRRVTRRHFAYDPVTDTWHRRCSLPTARAGAASVWTRGAISLIGGERRWLFGRFGRILIDDHLRYLPTADRWLTPNAGLGEPRDDVRLVAVYDQLWAIGGRTSAGWTPSFARFDPAQDGWIESTPLHEAIVGPGVAAVDGTVMVIGAMRAGGRGTLVEAAQVARRFYVHERTCSAEPDAFDADAFREAWPSSDRNAAVPDDASSSPSRSIQEDADSLTDPKTPP